MTKMTNCTNPNPNPNLTMPLSQLYVAKLLTNELSLPPRESMFDFIDRTAQLRKEKHRPQSVHR
jgi:hypothetical protein